MKIAVLTTFGSWSSSYSPCNVVEYQLKSLVRYGYSPVLFTLDVFPKDFLIEGVEVRRVLPAIAFEPYQGIASHRNVPNSFEKDVAKIVPAMDQHFKDIDIFLSHDVIFQDSFLAYNAALRKTILNPRQKFFHWTHSGPSIHQEVPEPISYLYSLPPQSRLVYMNSYDTVRMAEMYGTTIDNVRVVHNPIDYSASKNLHPLTKTIVQNYGLNSADVVAVYPLSTTRMGSGGKQLHKAIKVMAYIKELGFSVRYVVCNAHANGDREKQAIESMRGLAESYGLERQEIVFTSTIGKEWEHGVPHEVVTQLMAHSDIFLFPSVSENAPLVLLEAALGKNLLVLNEDFSPMKDFVGPNALYFKFDSVTTVTSHPAGEESYYRDVAKIIMAELLNNRIYKAHKVIKQEFNIDYIFKRQLEPLFFEQWGDASEGSISINTPSTPLEVSLPVETTELHEKKEKKYEWW